MDTTVTYYVVGEEGGHTRLTSGAPPSDLHINGAEGRLKVQGRRGAIVKVTGDIKTGSIEIVRTLNGAEAAPVDLIARMRARASGSRGNANNTIGRNING